ncbi:MAG: hypothetical protein NT062_01890 [Proteobacteria bacterium]|nr:hypothetical protein [Pseudomonadota bacterium]
MHLTLPALPLLLLVGCVDTLPDLSGTTSIKVEVVSPVDRGSFATRLDDAARDVVVNLTALDANGEPDPSFDGELGVYVQFLGTLSPYLTGTPLTTVQLTAGKATNKMITLPPVFGPTTLWFDDSKAADPTLATGASEPLWYRDPFIEDIQKPRLETALDALSKSTLELKQIAVHASKYGANGRLVVNSVFAQGYTVSDMQCGPGGAPPCTSEPYSSVMVFSFSAPRATSDEDEGSSELLREGQVISRFNGGVSEFNGLTEIGFPRTFLSTLDDVDPAREPKPAKFDVGWFAALSDPNGIINFERYEAAPIEIDNAVVCALDDAYTTFKQWKIDPSGTESAGGADCSKSKNVISLITSGVAADLDPSTLVGKKIPKIVGIVRPVNIGTFNVWIVYPRGMADLQLP